MYCAYDTEARRVVAVHDDIDVVEEYIQNLLNSRCDMTAGAVVCRKVKRKILSRMCDIDALYLTRFNKTWVQQDLVEYADLVNDHLYELENASSVLVSIIKNEELTRSEAKTLRNAVLILERIKEEASTATLTYDELQSLKCDYGQYVNKIWR